MWQQHGAGQCALIRPTAFIRTSLQLPADAFHLEPHEQEPLCRCFLNSVFNTRYLSTTGELPTLVKVYLPAFGFPSAMVSNEKPLGQPQMPASLSPPSSSSLLRYLPHTGGLQISVEPFQLIPACPSRRGREHKAVEVPSFRHLSTHLKQRPVRI